MVSELCRCQFKEGPAERNRNRRQRGVTCRQRLQYLTFSVFHGRPDLIPAEQDPQCHAYGGQRNRVTVAATRPRPTHRRSQQRHILTRTAGQGRPGHNVQPGRTGGRPQHGCGCCWGPASVRRAPDLTRQCSRRAQTSGPLPYCSVLLPDHRYWPVPWLVGAIPDRLACRAYPHGLHVAAAPGRVVDPVRRSRGTPRRGTPRRSRRPQTAAAMPNEIAGAITGNQTAPTCIGMYRRAPRR